MQTPKFVIFADPWNENIGGVVVLHELCHRLGELGYEASMWPSWRPAVLPRTLAHWRFIAGYLLRGRFLHDSWYGTGPYHPRIARREELRSSIVIYPEVIAGNPVKANKVVRWFLYKPGEHNPVVDYGEDDLFFFYNAAFNDTRFNQDLERLLRVSFLNPVYSDQPSGPREGACYMIRKGLNRSHDAHPSGAIPIDGLSHAECADIFRRTERFYCYDLYTYYALFAAICGCIPIVVPVPELPVEEWEPEPEHRFGVAYGEEQIPFAVETRPHLLSRLKKLRETENENVRSFVRIASTYFA